MMLQPSLAALLLLGLAVGVISGLVGIGGGVIIVPALVLIFRMPQHLAQGTTLAMLVPPIGILAAWDYYKRGHVDLRIAVVLCIGFIFGGLLGAKLAGALSESLLRRLFGAAMLGVAVKMLLA